jgi:hypothetical protein
VKTIYVPLNSLLLVKTIYVPLNSLLLVKTIYVACVNSFTSNNYDKEY